MSALSKINIGQNFPHLTRAPIVEAVIEIAAVPTVDYSEGTHRDILKSKLPEYPFLESARWIKFGVSFDEKSQPAQLPEDSVWGGLRFQNAARNQIALFSLTSFAFSRLAPYENWGGFISEAMRLWHIYKELLQPKNANRIGLRYINRIPAQTINFDEYLVAGPQYGRKLNLPLSGFTHIDQLSLPDSPFEIRVIQTVIPSVPSNAANCNLVLDIDVFTMQAVVVKPDVIEAALDRMRVLKNYVFFHSLTEKVIKSLK